MIKEFQIKNYKSILDHTIELGRLNVFIGENGCGKTNLLEAVAMASAALGDKLETEGVYSKGIRVAKPSITFSSFLGSKATNGIRLRCTRVNGGRGLDGEPESADFDIISKNREEIDAAWTDNAGGSHRGTVMIKRRFWWPELADF